MVNGASSVTTTAAQPEWPLGFTNDGTCKICGTKLEAARGTGMHRQRCDVVTGVTTPLKEDLPRSGVRREEIKAKEAKQRVAARKKESLKALLTR